MEVEVTWHLLALEGLKTLEHEGCRVSCGQHLPVTEGRLQGWAEMGGFGQQKKGNDLKGKGGGGRMEEEDSCRHLGNEVAWLVGSNACTDSRSVSQAERQALGDASVLCRGFAVIPLG